MTRATEAKCPTCHCEVHTPARTHAGTCVECEVVKFPILVTVPERYTCELCRVEIERLGRAEWDRRRERMRAHGKLMQERGIGRGKRRREDASEE